MRSLLSPAVHMEHTYVPPVSSVVQPGTRLGTLGHYATQAAKGVGALGAGYAGMEGSRSAINAFNNVRAVGPAIVNPLGNLGDAERLLSIPAEHSEIWNGLIEGQRAAHPEF